MDESQRIGELVFVTRLGYIADRGELMDRLHGLCRLELRSVLDAARWNIRRIRHRQPAHVADFLRYARKSIQAFVANWNSRSVSEQRAAQPAGRRNRDARQRIPRLRQPSPRQRKRGSGQCHRGKSLLPYFLNEKDILQRR